MAQTHKAPLIGGLHLSHHRHAAAQGFRIDAVLLQALAQLMLNGDVGGLLAIEAHDHQIQLIDQGHVVDDQLHVHGMAGLRIADASIMPTLTSGNTNAPSIMIGEKASRMILKDAA